MYLHVLAWLAAKKPKMQMNVTYDEEGNVIDSDWHTDSNSAIRFVMLGSDDDATQIEAKLNPHSPEVSDDCVFAPEFSHQLFENEKIVGFKEPKVTLLFAANSMHCSVSFSHSAAASAAQLKQARIIGSPARR
jgi:hypothetical protein